MTHRSVVCIKENLNRKYTAVIKKKTKTKQNLGILLLPDWMVSIPQEETKKFTPRTKSVHRSLAPKLSDVLSKISELHPEHLKAESLYQTVRIRLLSMLLICARVGKLLP